VNEGRTLFAQVMEFVPLTSFARIVVDAALGEGHGVVRAIEKR